MNPGKNSIRIPQDNTTDTGMKKKKSAMYFSNAYTGINKTFQGDVCASKSVTEHNKAKLNGYRIPMRRFRLQELTIKLRVENFRNFL
jgi:hypothetical protein